MNAGRIDGIKPIGIDDKQSTENMRKKPHIPFNVLANLLSGNPNNVQYFENGPSLFNGIGKSGNDAATTGI